MITNNIPSPNNPTTSNVIKLPESKHHSPVGQQNSLTPSQPKFQMNDLVNALISIHNES